MARRVKSKRIVVMVHEDLVPPEHRDDAPPPEKQAYRTEHDVISTLTEIGHQVQVVGLYEELSPLRAALKSFRPHVVFNLLEEFKGDPVLDYHVVAYLVLRGAAYTGCNPRGLLIARDKALSKKICHYHRIRVPHFTTFRRGRDIKRPKRLEYPAIVKSLTAEASEGISQASVVWDDEALRERVRFIHGKIGTDAIVEQYIDGREVYSSVVGNQRLDVFPTWEMELHNLPPDAARIATRKVKWDPDYQERHKIMIGPAEIAPELQRKIARTSRRIFRCLGLDGYVRIDYRLTPEGDLYFLEANPNPDIAKGQELAEAAAEHGLSYRDLLSRIVSLGIRRGASPGLSSA